MLVAVPDRGVFSPISVMASRKIWRSSALLMLGSLAPMSSTPYLSRIPFYGTGGSQLS